MAPTLTVPGVAGAVDISIALQAAPRCLGVVGVYEFSGQLQTINFWNTDKGLDTYLRLGQQVFSLSLERRGKGLFHGAIIDSNGKVYPADLTYVNSDSEISGEEMEVSVNGTPILKNGHWFLRDPNFISQGGHRFQFKNSKLIRICYAMKTKQGLGMMMSNAFLPTDPRAMLLYPYIQFDLDPKSLTIFNGVGPVIGNLTSGVFSIKVTSEDKTATISTDFVPLQH